MCMVGLLVEVLVVVLVVLVGLAEGLFVFLSSLSFASVAPFSKRKIQIVASNAYPVSLTTLSVLFMCNGGKFHSRI